MKHVSISRLFLAASFALGILAVWGNAPSAMSTANAGDLIGAGDDCCNWTSTVSKDCPQSDPNEGDCLATYVSGCGGTGFYLCKDRAQCSGEMNCNGVTGKYCTADN